MSTKISRRGALLTLGATGAGLALVGGGYTARSAQESLASAAAANEVVPFYNADTHQAGIATPAQEHLHFASFDLTSESIDEVRALLRIWTSAAATMTTGKPIGEGKFPEHTPPPDTGEALEHAASRLTITFGFGPTFFTRDGKDRYGLAARRPAVLTEIPPMPGDALQPERSGGDLCVQACSDNPLVAFHAVRNLARLARGLTVMRWSQLGFNRTASTSSTQETPRNLMGFKDGTNNIKAEDHTQMDQNVWVGARDNPTWMRGGSYLVARRIRMHLESWDRDYLADQETVIGRYKVSGAPLHGTKEFDTVNLQTKNASGEPAIPIDSHIRLAIGDGSIKLLRRGYSYTDGMDYETGELDAGLFFIAFQRNPQTQFIPLQLSLARNDMLNEYITHVGSAVFACPPGTHEGGFIGEGLFS
jgi:deferrochelatase/peroxidase EfeB